MGEIQKSPEKQQVESTLMSTPIKRGEGISNVATELGIRLGELNKIQNLGSVQQGDTFQLIRHTDGSGELKKMRTNSSFPLTKEAIYQNNETLASFPQIQFIRLSNTDEYELTGKNGEQLSKNPLIVSTANLDLLKREIDKVSGVFITECNSRKEISELSCNIQKGNGGNGFIELNSKNWYDILSKTVSMDGIQKLLKTSQTPVDIAGVLAKSFSVPNQRPNYENVTVIREPQKPIK